MDDEKEYTLIIKPTKKANVIDLSKINSINDINIKIFLKNY